MLKRLLNPGGSSYNMPTPYPNQYPMPMPGQNQMPSTYDVNRLQTEINELKRMNSDMLKRISRLENYLGIRGENNSL